MSSEKKNPMSFLEHLIQDDKKLKLMIFCGLCLIGILFLSSILSGEKKEKNTSETTVQTEVITMEQYVEQLEKKISDLVGRIDGAGRVQVMLTLENGSETVYQSDYSRQMERSETTGGSYQEQLQESVVVIEGENGQKQALIKTEKAPAIQGVVIVCDGAENSRVEQRITNAITTAFSISSARVAVVKYSAADGN